MIVKFDATLDDFVDLTMRSLALSKVTQSSRMRVRVISISIVALAALIFAPASLTIRLAVALIGAIVYVAISQATYKSSVEKRVRRLWLEQNGTDGPIAVEVELNESGVRVSQLDTQYFSDWSAFTKVEEIDGDVFFYRREGIFLAVRNRAFESAAARSEFIQLAQSLMNTAAGQRTPIDAGATDPH